MKFINYVNEFLTELWVCSLPGSFEVSRLPNSSVNVVLYLQQSSFRYMQINSFKLHARFDFPCREMLIGNCCHFLNSKSFEALLSCSR